MESPGKSMVIAGEGFLVHLDSSTTGQPADVAEASDTGAAGVVLMQSGKKEQHSFVGCHVAAVGKRAVIDYGTKAD